MPGRQIFDEFEHRSSPDVPQTKTTQALALPHPMDQVPVAVEISHRLLHPRARLASHSRSPGPRDIS